MIQRIINKIKWGFMFALYASALLTALSLFFTDGNLFHIIYLSFVTGIAMLRHMNT